MNNLIQQCVRSTDFWTSSCEHVQKLIESEQHNASEIIISMLTNQRDLFSQNEEMQKFIAWQLSEKSCAMNDVSKARELINADLFKMTGQFTSEQIDLRAISAIFMSSIYFLTLFSKNNSSTFCEIDFRSENGFARIINSMKNICKLLPEN